ncbi:hypothetical protein FOL47_009897 [Perkinsus chesapeaki]|uniref:non-specific serine/threonine protein kinase n=1 Tax=Perkinsus chesapeaki TaxID=330153 RepID=A0A7J6MQV8_PERCH|nr:hypothetical protein FOL47_009897 [Perkinsus chesapeaki]
MKPFSFVYRKSSYRPLDQRVSFGSTSEGSTRAGRDHCKFGCGRPCAQGFTASLERYDVCCWGCAQTNGKGPHDPLCNVVENTIEAPSVSTALGGPSGSALEIEERLKELAREPPMGVEALPQEGGLNENDMRKLVDRISEAVAVNNISDKNLLILFTRFCDQQTGLITRNEYPSFWRALLRFLRKSLKRHTPKLRVHRAFHVLRNNSSGGVRKVYNFLETVGRGSFGVVHKVVHRKSEQLRVCKSVDKAKSSVPLSQLEEEIKIISQLDHPNVIKIYEYFEDPKHIHLIMEACWGGELLSVIQKAVNKGVCPPAAFIADVTREVLTALSFMHNQGVVHKDLKPENILFVDMSAERCMYPGGPPRASGNVKVIDFGLAELFARDSDKSMNVAGTAFYMAPEIFRPPFDYKCDIWSLGIVVYLMLTGYLPFFGSSVSEVKSNVLYKRVQWPDYICNSTRRLRVPKAAKDLVERMLVKDPELREGASELLKHPWFDKASSNGSGGWKSVIKLLSGGVVDCMCYYARQDELKKAVVNLIAHQWSFEEQENVRNLFTGLDLDSEGCLPVTRMAEALQQCQVKMNPSDARRIASAMDRTGDGYIGYTEFVAACIIRRLQREEGVIKAAYRSFTPSKPTIGMSNALKAPTVQEVAEALWEVLAGERCALTDYSDEPDDRRARAVPARPRMLDVSMERFKGWIEEMDANNDGYISFEDFRLWLAGQQ